MSEEWHGVCPHCRHRMHVHGRHTKAARITCPGCHTAFTIPSADTPLTIPPPRSAGGRGMRLAALSVLLGCLLLGVATLVLVLWAGSARKEAPSTGRVAEIEMSAIPEEPPEEPILTPPPKAKTPDTPPLDEAPPPLLPSPTAKPAPPPTAKTATSKPKPIKWLPPQEQAKVDRAVARGVAWLRQNQLDDGSWGGRESIYQRGSTALAGLALLHCGVPSRDPAVQKAADYLRRKVTNTYRNVYASALMILFLDRLGDRRDEDIIGTLSAALIKGQMPSGKWTYSVPNLSANAERSVLAQLRKSGSVPPWESFSANGGFVETGSSAVVGPFVIGEGDYSNTQFAVMGLWAAARHQVPSQQALARAVRRFRQTQAVEGGWGYEDAKAPYLSMTAAALYGLAVGHGLSLADSKESTRDPALDKGMQFLGKSLDNGFDPLRQVPQVVSFAGQFPFYGLWSLERTAVILNARTIDGRDWYTWGVGRVLADQKAKGCWQSKGESPSVATPFALLFLSRADVAPELTRSIRYVKKDGRMLLVKTPDKSLRSMFDKKNSTPLEMDVTLPSPRQKSKAREIKKPLDEGR